MDLNLCEKYQHVCVCLCVLQVIILDPTQEYAAELLSVAEMFYANNIPLRFVFVSLGMKIHQQVYFSYLKKKVPYLLNIRIFWSNELH